jgi:uncharacterized protein YbjT (DUF2867 family)
MAFQKIAIAGATGYLGRKVLSHLLTLPKIAKITVLTRNTTHYGFPSSPILSVVSISSYEDRDAVASTLQGHDLLISTIAGIAVENVDAHLTVAAMTAGVKRFMPSEYTLDVMHPHAISIAGSTVLAGRIRSARDLEALAEIGAIEYTIIVSGGTLDWWFENGNLGLDMKRKKAILYDGGEKEVTGSTTDFIAQCVGAVVQMDQEQTKNKRIRIAEVKYSGKKLLKVFEEVTGEKWEVQEKSTNVLLNEGREAGAKGDMRGFYLGNILKLNFDGEGAAFFEEGLSFGDGLVQRRSLTDIVKTAFHQTRR